MGNFKDNPKKPYEVRVPNKIRTRIAMHEQRKDEGFGFVKPEIYPRAQPLRTVYSKKRGSMWSRFTSGVVKMLQIKPTGVRE